MSEKHDERLLTSHLSFIWEIADHQKHDTFDLGRMFYGNGRRTALTDLVDWGYVQDVTRIEFGTMRNYKLTPAGSELSKLIIRHYNDFFWSDATWAERFEMGVKDAARRLMSFDLDPEELSRLVAVEGQLLTLGKHLKESNIVLEGTATLREVTRDLLKGVFRSDYLPEWIPTELRGTVTDEGAAQ